MKKLLNKYLQELWSNKNKDVSQEVSAIQMKHRDNTSKKLEALAGILYIVHEDFKGRCFISEVLENERTILIFSEKEITPQQAEDAAHKIYG